MVCIGFPGLLDRKFLSGNLTTDRDKGSSGNLVYLEIAAPGGIEFCGDTGPDCSIAKPQKANRIACGYQIGKIGNTAFLARGLVMRLVGVLDIEAGGGKDPNSVGLLLRAVETHWMSKIASGHRWLSVPKVVALGLAGFAAAAGKCVFGVLRGDMTVVAGTAMDGLRDTGHSAPRREVWWSRQGSNLQPTRYERGALTN